MEWQGKLARKMKADAVLRGGDSFHVKAANKTTMATMALVSGIHRKYPCPTHALPGNHDMSNNDPDSIPRQPLGVMFRAGVFQELRDTVFTSGSLKARVVGVEYTTDLDDEGLKDRVKKKDDIFTIAFVHALATFAPQERIQTFFGEKVFDYRDLVFPGCPDVYVFAHYHKDQGIREHLGIHFVNLGAVSRGALTFENMERCPKVGSIILNSQGVSIEEHEIPVRDAKEVFDLERKVQLERERRNLNEFIQRLRADASGPEDGGIRQRMADFQVSSFPDDVKGRVLETLEAAEAGVLEE
jgi:DNA repair exonuclease SbcCD nuclease subunit